MPIKPAEETKSEPVRREAPKRVVRFEAPAEIPAKFHLDSDVENHLTGIVSTEDVRELLDAFGLAERKDVVFPFQHILKHKGETWSMRIEPLAAHTLNGKPVLAHAWVYTKQFPEQNGAPA